MREVKIAPSILSGDFARMGESVDNVEKWGADLVHFDVMDGVYVPNITFGMPMCKAVRNYTKLPLDVHLMIVEPEKYIAKFIDAGADIITFHPEASKDVIGAINIAKERGKRVGLVLNPDKDLELITPYLHLIDVVIIMGVFPGFGGQKFIPHVLDKVKALREIFDGDIELDGGVTVDNAHEIVSAGVNILVGGSSVFSAADPSLAISKLRGDK